MARRDDAALSGPTRRDPVALIWLAAALLAARIVGSAWNGFHPPVVEKNIVEWSTIADAPELSRRSGRPILYEFTAGWCPPCQRMKQEVFSDPVSAARINAEFIPVRIMDRNREDGKNIPEIETLQKRFHIDSFPTLVVVPARGGAPSQTSGYGSRQDTMDWLTTALRQARPKPR